MIRDTYHIKVKAEHASTILEDLLEKGEIEIIQEEDDTPEWHKQEVMRRIKAFEANPSSALSEEKFFALLDEDDEV